MKGKYNIFVQNNRLRYEFTISRNITLIRGDSATGKTTLLDLLNAYDRDGESSGILLKRSAPSLFSHILYVKIMYTYMLAFYKTS